MATAICAELTCPICLELFQDPVTLACMHSYCRHCLGSILKSSGGKILCCPECRLESTMNNDDLQKLPRNFTIANIVAKCEREDKVPQVPCDLCDEKPPSSAIKSCKECKISYCGQCLFLHPKRGILATHTLVDPQKFHTVIEKKPLEKFCMKCFLIFKYDDDKGFCQHDHPEEIVDTEAAQTKIMSDMQEACVRLEEKKKQYINDLQTTEGILNNLKVNEEKTKAAITEEMNKICEEATNKAKSDFQERVDGIQEVIKNETKTINDEYDKWTKETRDINEHYLCRLQDASAGVTGLIADMQSIFATKTGGGEVDVKDLIKTYKSLNEAENNRESAMDLYTEFNLFERLDRVKLPTHVKTEGKRQKGPTGTITILSCTSCPRRMDGGASVTVVWSSTFQEVLFELEFKELTNDERRSTFTIRGIRGYRRDEHVLYTENRLSHNTSYDVTVTIQDQSSSGSTCKRFTTPPGVHCDPFQFSSLVKHRKIGLRWDNKAASNSMNEDFHQNSPVNPLKRVWGAVGTIPLRNSSQYWESSVTYHLRGVEKDSYCAAVGICAKGKMEVASCLGVNYFFYGVTLCKDKRFSPALSIIEKGFKMKSIAMKHSRQYNEKLGFHFDSRRQQLVIIDVNTNSILHRTGTLKKQENMEFEYYPCCHICGVGDPSIELITGPDLKQFPSCLEEAMK